MTDPIPIVPRRAEDPALEQWARISAGILSPLFPGEQLLRLTVSGVDNRAHQVVMVVAVDGHGVISLVPQVLTAESPAARPRVLDKHDRRILQALLDGPLGGKQLAVVAGIKYATLRGLVSTLKKMGLVDISGRAYFLTPEGLQALGTA